MRKIISLAASLEAIQLQPAQELTVAELVRAYAVSRLDGNDARLKKWLGAFGERSAWTISSEELETAATAMLAHGYKASAVNRDLSAMGSVYRWAREKRISPRGFRSPTLGVRRYDEGIRRVHLDRDQLQALRDRSCAFADPRFPLFVHLLIETGARKSELLERRWADVDLARREILAPTTKNGTPRVLFFSELTAQMIERKFARRAPGMLIFEGRVPGEPISFRASWRTLCTDVGLKDLHMHDLRHAAAANMLKAGVTLPVAAQVLGHDPAVLARRYGHLETAALRRAQEAAWHAAATGA